MTATTASGNPDDPNLKTLLEFKKTVAEEQKAGDKRIDEINAKLEAVKKQIDEERKQLDEHRPKLKQINEEKDAEYPKFVELRNNLIEAKNQMRNLDDKVSPAAAKSRKERGDMHNLQKTLEQIERDIQTKKLSKDEERKLVARSKEIATKLHALKVRDKKKGRYDNMSVQYDHLKSQVNQSCGFFARSFGSAWGWYCVKPAPAFSWQVRHVARTLRRCTDDRVSPTERISCAVWQSAQLAARSDPRRVTFP